MCLLASTTEYHLADIKGFSAESLQHLQSSGNVLAGVLVVAFLALSSANGAAFVGPGEQ